MIIDMLSHHQKFPVSYQYHNVVFHVPGNDPLEVDISPNPVSLCVYACVRVCVCTTYLWVYINSGFKSHVFHS